MPEILRGAVLSIDQGIELPMSPPLIIHGKGKDGKVVCQLHISATNIIITGPKGKELCKMNWDELAEWAQS